ncbi:MAG: hypothetical protein AB7N29_23470 [Vicinamibacterales bacterium]
MQRTVFIVFNVCVLGLAVACGGGSSAPTAPSGTSTATSSSSSASTAGTSGAATDTATGTPATATSSECQIFGGGTLNISRRSADGAFTHAPFTATDLGVITNGQETNDPRFTYQWIRNRGSAVNIYAPADGVLVRLRHKTAGPNFPSDDFDLFFLVACEPGLYRDRDVMFRFNHITDPRDDIRAAYRAGSLPSQEIGAQVIEFEDRQVPTSNIRVSAGELLGSTRGTPGANNFDFQIGINNATVCPFAVLNEPHRSTLLAMMGPQSATPSGPPVPGFPCTGFGGMP